MTKREKIEKIYQKNNVKVSDKYIDNVMKDKKRVKEFMKLYEKEKIWSMNYIIGEPLNNKSFTNFELKAMSKIDLFNNSIIEICKNIWSYKDDEQKKQQVLKLLKKTKKEVVTYGNTCIYFR